MTANSGRKRDQRTQGRAEPGETENQRGGEEGRKKRGRLPLQKTRRRSENNRGGGGASSRVGKRTGSKGGVGNGPAEVEEGQRMHKEATKYVQGDKSKARQAPLGQGHRMGGSGRDWSQRGEFPVDFR